MPKIRGNMNRKKFPEYCDQLITGGRKQTIGRVAGLSHEDQPVLTADSATSWALWRLSLILREIAESLGSDAEKEASPPQAPAGNSLTSGEEGGPHE